MAVFGSFDFRTLQTEEWVIFREFSYKIYPAVDEKQLQQSMDLGRQ